MQLIFAWLTLTLRFCKATVKHAVKQMIWVLACSFFKHIRICCEKLWLNVIFVWIAAVFHSFLFLLTLISFVGMDFQIFCSFFQVMGFNTFGVENFLQNTQKMGFYMANYGKIFNVYYEVFLKVKQENLSIILSSYLFIFFFQVYFGETMWLILYFTKFSS